MLAGLLERFLDAAGTGAVKTGKFAFDVEKVEGVEDIKDEL